MKMKMKKMPKIMSVPLRVKLTLSYLDTRLPYIKLKEVNGRKYIVFSTTHIIETSNENYYILQLLALKKNSTLSASQKHSYREHYRSILLGILLQKRLNTSKVRKKKMTKEINCLIKKMEMETHNEFFN